MSEVEMLAAPVTRGELKEELAQLEERFDRKLEKLEERLEQKLDEKLEQKLNEKLKPYATKADLEVWGGALLERMDQITVTLSAELARHTAANQEQHARDSRLSTRSTPTFPRE